MFRSILSQPAFGATALVTNAAGASIYHSVGLAGRQVRNPQAIAMLLAVTGIRSRLRRRRRRLHRGDSASRASRARMANG
jgi:hypothetical protein